MSIKVRFHQDLLDVACEVFSQTLGKALNIQCYTHVGVQDKIKSIVYHPTQELTNLRFA